MQLPYAVIAVSVLSAVYPQVSRSASHDPERYAALVSGGLRILLALLLPAAVLLAVLAEPLTRVLLGYGAVDEPGVRLIATAVSLFALALLPFTAFQLLTRACFACGDTRGPALVNVAVNVVNVVGALLALRSAGTGSLAVLVGAYAASYVGGCLLLGAHLGRRCPGVLAGTAALAVRLLSPVGAMVAVALLVRGLVEGERTGGAVSAAGTVLVVALASGTTHLLLLRWCAPTVVAEVTGRVRRTRHRS